MGDLPCGNVASIDCWKLSVGLIFIGGSGWVVWSM